MDIGDNWNGWTVESFIGEGSFGKVYRIVRKDFGHTYESALKVIRIPQTGAEINAVQNEGMSSESVTSYFYGMVEDIVSEVALMSELKGNSNIVSYEDHSVVELKDTFGWEIFIRMEMLTPLFEYLQNHTMTVRDVIRMGTDLCRALELCEKCNLIHRDIKPENIFISRQGSYKLGDFGIAKQMEKTHTELSKKGTFSYMAPEVYKGLSYNSTVDVYSLGVVLYRFLNNNRTPFLPPYPEAIRYSDKQKANDLRMSGSPLPVPCNAEGSLAEVILKACAYRPEDRYKTAEDMRKALGSIKISDADDRIIYPSSDREDHVQNDTAFRGADTGKGAALDPTVALFDDAESECQANREQEIAAEAPEAEIPQAGSVGDRPDGKKSGKKKMIIAAVLVIAAAAGLYRLMFCSVPVVTGMEEETAKATIENAGLEYSGTAEFTEDTDRGLVVSQTGEGKVVRRGTTVEVVISRGKAIEIPDITGKSRKKAAEALKNEGLQIKVESREYSDTLAKDLVISQRPEAGEKCEEDTEISVILSKGITQVAVPDVLGRPTEEAVSELEKAGLKTEVTTSYSSAYPAGYVCGQSSEPNEKVDIYSVITIYESIGPEPQKASSGSGSSSRRKSSGGSNRNDKPERKVDTFG